jgi:hypothetical protein
VVKVKDDAIGFDQHLPDSTMVVDRRFGLLKGDATQNPLKGRGGLFPEPHIQPAPLL